MQSLFNLLMLGAGLVPAALAGYTIQDDYSGNNFFSMFTFDTEDDPTHGYVNYVDQATAQSEGLVSVSNGVVTMKADATKTGAGRGRDSVRVTSTKSYTHGLVILDLEHMPGNACGIWPAFWMTGPNWPNNGEIDIIEGVNYQAQDSLTMHTNGGCSMVGKDCQGNVGCGVQSGGSASYGDGFNQGQGGVYATEWTSDAINIWFFPRSGGGGGLTNALSGNPDPTTWGTPLASFQGGSDCNIDEHFQSNNLVFDITFCGDWAGGVWGQDATCSPKAGTCIDYVQNNPSAFTEAYWSINSLKVYSSNGAASNAATPQAGEKDGAKQPVPVSSPAPPPVASSTPPAPSPTTSAASGNGANEGKLGENPASAPAPAPAPAPSSQSQAPAGSYWAVEHANNDPNPNDWIEVLVTPSAVSRVMRREMAREHLNMHRRHVGAAAAALS